MPTTNSAAPAAAWVASLTQSMMDAPVSLVLVVLAIVTMGVAVVALVQARRWPSALIVPAKAKPEAPKPRVPERTEAPPPKPSRPRPVGTTEHLIVAFPSISERHPDVWDGSEALDVLVIVERAHFPASAALHVTLAGQVGDERRAFGGVVPDEHGHALFSVAPGRRGEIDLVAELYADGAKQGQAVRAIRIVDYRAEIVETFDDFVSWAASQFGFVSRKRTAREFVDQFADGRPGTPVAPLETIVDIYELANFSEHAIDRSTYLRLVDAFLELEEAGALEGPAEAR